MNLNKRFMCYSVSFVIILKCIFIITATSPKSYPITTLINAKWLQTPLYLEISEYLSDENSILFWEYVDKIYDADIPLNQIDIESKNYITSINYAKSLLGSMQISILKLAVSMHTLTPRVQLHLQLANETFKNADHSKCDSNRNPSSLPSTFLLVPPNDIICDINSFKQHVNNKRNTEEENTILDYAFDHIYPRSENNSYPVILYSDIGSSEFRAFHKILKKMAINGEIRYILRHNIKNIPNRKVRLSGYGVELHLKSTEYKSQDDSKRPIDAEARPPKTDDIEMEVDGFDFNVLKARYPDLSHSLDRFLENLIQKSEEIEPLKAWEFQDLGLQAAQRVSSINGEESLQILQFTVQNFPTQAKFLLTQSVSEDLRKEMKHNTEIFGRTLNLQPPDAAIFINGLYFDTDTLDLTVLLETLRTELTVLTGLFNNNIQGKFASSLLTLNLSPSSSKEFAIDIRDTAVLWINDIENDPQYKRWPSSVMDLLKPTFPGMLRNVRKNLFNLVLIVDPLVVDNRGLVKLAESFIIHLAPIRLGLVFDTRKQTEKTKSDYRALFCAFNYISQKQNPRVALGFLTDVFVSASKHKNVKYDDIRIEFKKSNPKLKDNEINGILGEDSDYDYGQQLSAEFIERMGFKNSPQALLNGVPIQQNLINVDDLEEAVFTEIIQKTPNLQKSVYRGDLSDTDRVIDFLMDQPHVMTRLNQRILYTDDQKLLDITGTVHHLENINELLKLSKRDMIATALENLKYFTSKNSGEKIIDGKRLYFTTLWIIADLEDSKGRTIFINALKHMKSSGQTRIAFIPNCNHSSNKTDSNNNNNGKSYNLNKLVWAASQVLPETENDINLILKWLKNSENILDDNIPEQIKDFLSETDLHMKVLRVFAQQIFNVKELEIVVANNGKIIGPLLKDEILTVDDFGLMERYNNYQYADKLRNLLKLHKDNEGYHVTSDTIFKLTTILLSRQQTKNRFTIPNDLQDNHSVIKLPPKDKSLPFFDITAILDPASKPAQKITPILVLLRNVVNCNMKVYLCAVEHHSDMPVKNFYRFVIEPEIQFKPDGKLSSGPYAKFTGLPTTSLLTQNLQVPENWLVEVVRSVYDLDNIKLIDIGGPVHSEYELEYLLLEGHCFDSMTGSPPRGLQITLGTKDNPTMVDTIVMANLGYFQLKANPNIWELRLREGRSSAIYDIISVEGLHTIQHNNSIIVVISSLRSHVIKLRVSKKSDKLNVDLLSDDDTDDNSIWSSITSSFTSSSNNKETEILNIFSLASGHLYERLLRIMMLSVLKQTKAPVKFWFLKNYLSPQFTDFLPHMATEYGFQYELVQYKWPRWLHQQTEKQRTIWGYKILFLDVLFPLDVKKIIFVDADAIVRTDLTELNKMDLNGAPYAYTPFCDSRKEMEGFRFWKQGYWRNHLMGRKYHISALYVVDLKKFRKIAAGDRLRGQYQALSQDPNSLSNLDQDLPNNMIHQVPIKSLPEEWLWCETWCNDDSLKKAKVIDLCNNPLTKEAKLTAAQRIVPEWKKYDNEIKELVAKIEDHEMEQNQLSIDDKEKIEKLGEFVHSEL